MKAKEKARIKEIIDFLEEKRKQYFEKADKAEKDGKTDVLNYHLGKSSGFAAAKIELEEFLEEVEDQEKFMYDQEWLGK